MIRLAHAHQTRSMRIYWLLKELGVDFEVELRPFDKTLRAPEFLARSPVGRIPALEIDGRTSFESGAIMQILCARFPDAGLGRAQDDPEWEDWLVWLHFAETLSQHTASLTQQHIMLREDFMRSPTVMRLEAARAGKCFDAIERRLAGRDFLLDGGFSAADIAVAQAVYMALHFTTIGERPAMAAWYERLTSRPAFMASLPPEGAPRLYAKDFYPVPED